MRAEERRGGERGGEGWYGAQEHRKWHPPTPPRATRILHAYCTHIAHILHTYCTHTCARPMVVVLLPSPSGVGLMPVTTM